MGGRAVGSDCLVAAGLTATGAVPPGGGRRADSMGGMGGVAAASLAAAAALAVLVCGVESVSVGGGAGAGAPG